MTNTTASELIKQVATQHKIVLGDDDPILILHTANELLLEKNLNAQKEILEQYKSETEALIKRWHEEAKDSAEKILNASLSASKKVMEENAESLSKSLSADLNTQSSKIIQGFAQEVKKYITVLITCTAIIGLGAATMLWYMLSL